MVSFEIFGKAMLPTLSELKVLPSFCFAFKIPDNVTASIVYMYISGWDQTSVLVSVGSVDIFQRSQDRYGSLLLSLLW